jgi:hypothetical protein
MNHSEKALRRSTCSVRASVRPLHAHTAHRLRTRNTSSPLPGRCFLPHGARGHLCISGSTHALAPTPPFVSLTTMVFFACLSAVARRQKSASLLSAPARFAATWLPNPETPSWAASLEGMRLSVRDELRSHTPHAIPLILAARCWWLHVCIETLEAPFSLQPRVVPYLHAAEYTRCL